MSPDPSPFNPSRTVERIREIIVGRHLERLEQRVAKLETTAPSSPGSDPPADGIQPPSDHAAPLDILKQNVERMVATTRQQTEEQLARHRAETQRLALQIQQVAAMKAAEAPVAVKQLEHKLGSWLSDWQTSFHVHLHDRDRRLANQLRTEVAALWENTESQLTRLESRTFDRDAIEERFNRIALAARALAECASPSSLNSNTPGT